MTVRDRPPHGHGARPVITTGEDGGLRLTADAYYLAFDAAAPYLELRDRSGRAWADLATLGDLHTASGLDSTHRIDGPLLRRKQPSAQPSLRTRPCDSCSSRKPSLGQQAPVARMRARWLRCLVRGGGRGPADRMPSVRRVPCRATVPGDGSDTQRGAVLVGVRPPNRVPGPLRGAGDTARGPRCAGWMGTRPRALVLRASAIVLRLQPRARVARHDPGWPMDDGGPRGSPRHRDLQRLPLRGGRRVVRVPAGP